MITSNPGDEPVEERQIRVISIIAEILSCPPEDISVDTNILTDLNADSMDVVTIAAALAEEFSLDIDLEEIPEKGVTIRWILTEMGNSLS